MSKSQITRRSFLTGLAMMTLSSCDRQEIGGLSPQNEGRNSGVWVNSGYRMYDDDNLAIESHAELSPSGAQTRVITYFYDEYAEGASSVESRMTYDNNEMPVNLRSTSTDEWHSGTDTDYECVLGSDNRIASLETKFIDDYRDSILTTYHYAANGLPAQRIDEVVYSFNHREKHITTYKNNGLPIETVFNNLEDYSNGESSILSERTTWQYLSDEPVGFVWEKKQSGSYGVDTESYRYSYQLDEYGNVTRVNSVDRYAYIEYFYEWIKNPTLYARTMCIFSPLPTPSF